ncbi:MAG TPA: alpha/beta fold hydrolase, partial [Woeseiaceae bacterium]|nr:alpha/beta fold hydrolase [Woeseiaceae bacterium]
DGTYLGDYRVAQQIRACQLWPVGMPPDAMTHPVFADTPALLITGERDPVTPPSDAALVATGFPNVRVVIVPHAGHLPFDTSDPACIDRLMLDFLQRGSIAGLDLACLEALEPPPFALR